MEVFFFFFALIWVLQKSERKWILMEGRQTFCHNVYYKDRRTFLLSDRLKGIVHSELKFSPIQGKERLSNSQKSFGVFFTLA